MSWAIYGAVLFASVAMMVREGLWSNTIKLFNIIISGLVAYGFYSPITAWLDEQTGGSFTYILDFILIWAVFVIAFVVLRAVTGYLSRTRMRFKHPIDPVGGPLMALLAAWVLSGFTLSTLIMVPMPPNMFTERGESVVQADPEAGFFSRVVKVYAFTPESLWMGFIQMTTTSISYGPSRNRDFSIRHYGQIYRGRRAKLEEIGADAPWLRVNRSGN
jgi:hypothetical protein